MTTVTAPTEVGSSTTTPSPATTGLPVSSAAPVATAAGVATSTGAAGCSALTARLFVHVTAVSADPGGSLTLTGNPAKIVCGGPDDSHYNVASTIETAHVIAGADITVFPLAEMRLVPLAPDKLAAYLRTDSDTRIFLVSGPIGAIRGLQEEFHP